MADDGTIASFHAADNSASLNKFIMNANDRKNVETMMSLKNLSNFLRTREIPLINVRYLMMQKQQHLQ